MPAGTGCRRPIRRGGSPVGPTTRSIRPESVTVGETTSSSAAAVTSTVSYNGFGQVTSAVHAVGTAAESTTTFEYDPAHPEDWSALRFGVLYWDGFTADPYQTVADVVQAPGLLLAGISSRRAGGHVVGLMQAQRSTSSGTLRSTMEVAMSRSSRLVEVQSSEEVERFSGFAGVTSPKRPGLVPPPTPEVVFPQVRTCGKPSSRREPPLREGLLRSPGWNQRVLDRAVRRKATWSEPCPLSVPLCSPLILGGERGSVRCRSWGTGVNLGPWRWP